MAAVGYRTFDERPAMVAAADGPAFGATTMVHVMTAAMGYSTAAEPDGYRWLFGDRLLAGTQVYGYDTVRDRIDELRTELDAIEDRVNEIEAMGGLDYYDGPDG